MNKLAAEILGTFALVFAGCNAIITEHLFPGTVTHVGISLVFGLVVMALVYGLGDISGAHLNPAVTIGFAIGKRFSWLQVVPYVLAQCVGAIAAAALLQVLYPSSKTLGQTLPSGPDWQSFVLEIVLTWLLMFVILRVSTGAKEKGIMAGAAVGATVGLDALFGGPICGASMNPARSLGPALMARDMDELWIYIAAPLIGAVLAVLSERLVCPPNANCPPAGKG